jgi:4-amino-4-deoxy-L-arabinose transferase-like glycosyltransferase
VTTRRDLAILAVAAALLYFIRLGSTDLAFWDEILYATRALSIGHESGWLDQTAGSVGGLWTAAHPPLLIWQMAGLTALFGPSEWALRAPAALAGIGCVLVLYLLVRRLAIDPAVARIAAGALLLTPYFTQYARRAQLDVPVLFWILLCLYCGWRGVSGPLRWFALSGVALGLGLMSKILVAFLGPIILGVFLLSEAVFGSRGRAARGFVGVALMMAIGAAIAAPWHLYMTATLGPSYWTQALGYHVLSRTWTPLEGHSSSLGVFYWPHQILVRLGPFFPFLLVGLSREGTKTELGDGARRFLACWVLVPLFAFTIVATKFHPYVLLFLVPLVVFAALGIHATWRGAVRPAVAGALLPASLSCLVWSVSLTLQRHLESVVAALDSGHLPPGPDLAPVVTFALGSGAAIALGGFAARVTREGTRRARISRASVVAALLPALVLALVPLARGHGSWRELRSELRRTTRDRVILICEDPAVGRYQLRAARLPARAAWTVVPRDSAGFALQALERSDRSSSCFVVETSGKDSPPRAAGFKERWRNRRFVLFERI